MSLQRITEAQARAARDLMEAHQEVVRLRRALEAALEEARELRALVGWLLPYATYPECVCQKSHECECNVEGAQAFYRPVIERARSALVSGERE